MKPSLNIGRYGRDKIIMTYMEPDSLTRIPLTMKDAAEIRDAFDHWIRTYEANELDVEKDD